MSNLETSHQTSRFVQAQLFLFNRKFSPQCIIIVMTYIYASNEKEIRTTVILLLNRCLLSFSLKKGIVSFLYKIFRFNGHECNTLTTLLQCNKYLF